MNPHDPKPVWREALWNQFGASIDMLENAIAACPEDLWSDRAQKTEPWHLVYHTLFWLDFYASESPEGFAPPPPFTLIEMDPAGLFPDRVYTKEEMRAYLGHCRTKCRKTILSMQEADAASRFRYEWMDFSRAELFLYNMRHVQHGAAQLNLILRRETDSAPRWVGRVREAKPLA
jgi:hypothetical protein